jgi:hypothetical protein
MPTPIQIAFPLPIDRYVPYTLSISFPDINSGLYLDIYRRFTRSYLPSSNGQPNPNAEGFVQYLWSDLQANPASLLPPRFPGATSVTECAGELVAGLGRLIADSASASNAIAKVVFTTFGANDISKLCDGSGFPFLNQRLVRPTCATDVPMTLRQIIDAKVASVGTKQSYAFVYVDSLYVILGDSDLQAPSDTAIQMKYALKQTQVLASNMP